MPTGTMLLSVQVACSSEDHEVCHAFEGLLDADLEANGWTFDGGRYVKAVPYTDTKHTHIDAAVGAIEARRAAHTGAEVVARVLEVPTSYLFKSDPPPP